MTIEELKIKMPWIDVTEWEQHQNGGGWKQNTATVDDSVYLSSNAQIYGNEQVSGDARVSGDAPAYQVLRVTAATCDTGRIIGECRYTVEDGKTMEVRRIEFRRGGR